MCLFYKVNDDFNAGHMYINTKMLFQTFINFYDRES